jgi:beta-phosphoglucomutase family hydrolase
MGLGVPDSVTGFLFDMDGVLTRTATLHASAWKQAFDEFLRRRDGDGYRPFDEEEDYEEYVDGRSRLDGTRAFLQSRSIHLPDDQVAALADRKNDLVQQLIDSQGVDVFADARDYVRAVAAAGMARAVVSSSANTEQILDRAGIADLFDARIDGLVAIDRHLAGKPAPDMFLAGAEALGLRADQCVVFEDALAGVAAGRAGHFAFVVGVDRVGQADQLRQHGADVAVSELTELLNAP